MKNTYLWGGLIVLLLILGIWAFYTQGDITVPVENGSLQNQSSGANNNPGQNGISLDVEGSGDLQINQVITRTDSGFVPATLTARKGETVIFRNDSSSPTWPASARHPTHEVYPESGGCISSMFDACRNLEKGQSWPFTFNQVGEWAYHDHLNPQFFGKVIVTE